MKKWLLILCYWLVGWQAQAQESNYTVIVSLDGFRWDYPLMYRAPFLEFMAKNGVSASMLPSFPSKTFPNHYTMATGLVPDHHGIVANSFYDPDRKVTYSMNIPETRNDASYYGGEPIWITAQKQGVKTGNLYWVGSDIAVKGQHPTYYRVYAQQPRLTYAERIAETLALLRKPEEERPRLVMVYMEEPDHTGHHHGPASPQACDCVQSMDALMEELWKGLQTLPIAGRVNLIVTSDHGMTSTDPERIVRPSDYLRPEWYEKIDGNLPALIYTKKGKREQVYRALKDVPHIRVWKREEIPAYLQYGTNPRVGDIVVLPDLGWLFQETNKTLPGSHGYDPTYSDMHVMFRAMGPDFKQGFVSPRFHNVDLYPLLARLLKITPEQTDGKIERISQILREK